MGQLCVPVPTGVGDRADAGEDEEEEEDEFVGGSIIGSPPSTASDEPESPESAPPLILVEAETGSSEEAAPRVDDSDSDGETARLAQEYEEIVAEMQAADLQARQPLSWLRRA